MRASSPQRVHGRFNDHPDGLTGKGSIAGWSLMLLFALTSMLVPAGIWVTSGMVSEREGVERSTELQEIQHDTEEVIRFLENDSTPRAESQHDEVWSYLRRLERSGNRIGLSDLSSSGAVRVYANANSSSPERLRQILLCRGVQSTRAAEIAHSISTRQERGGRISTRELQDLLGGFSSQVIPFVDTLPEINVNFAPRERIIESVARTFGADRTSVAEKIVEGLIRLRAQSELSGDALEHFLRGFAVTADDVSNLGVHTWVWGIRHRRGRREYQVTAVRLAYSERPTYRVIGAHWRE